MRTFAPKPKALKTRHPATTPVDRSRLNQGYQVDRRADVKGDSVASGPAGFSYDFSRIPRHAKIQPELRFTTANDTLEQEADRISQQLTGMSEPRLQRERQHNRPATNDSTSSDLAPHTVPPTVRHATGSPGRPLDRDIRSFMENALGYDFSTVRIHADAVAASSARAVNANAYTLGQHIVFGSGQYAPQSDRGKRLLAHELVHVTQQRAQAAPILARQPAQKPLPPDAPQPAPPDAAVPATKQPAQQKPAQQGLCSKVDLSKLRLPRKNNAGAEFFESTAEGIRFLAAVSGKQASQVRGKIKDVANMIAKLSRLSVTPAASKVTLVIVTEGASMFRSLCGQPVLLIDTPQFTPETAAHETMHGVTAALLQQSQGTGAKAAGAKNFLDQVADIYRQLSALTIEISPGVQVYATNLVDPQTLDPKAAPEHPGQNVDEFLSSAVAVYLDSKKALEKKIKEFGKKDPKLKAAADQLMKLLDDFIGKQTLPPKPAKTTSTSKEIELEEKAIKPTEELGDTELATHGLLTELLLPPSKTP